MKRLALGIVLVTGLALLAGRGSASPVGHWVATDIDHQAQAAFAGYTRRRLLGMTAGGRVLWTAEKVGGSQYDREVFQWRKGVVADLGALPHDVFVADWNRGGAIVGWYLDPPYCGRDGPPGCRNGPTHAYLWQPGKTTQLGSLGGRASAAGAINDHGQIVGGSQTARGVNHAFLWQNGKMTDITPRGMLTAGASAINNRGQVLEVAGSGPETYFWQHGKVTKLGGHLFEAIAINDRGQVVGSVIRVGSPRYRVVLWQDAKTTDLLTTEDPYYSAINDKGDVMLWHTNGTTHRALLWHEGKLTDLGDLGGGSTVPEAINDRGQIVGTSTLPGSTEQIQHAAAFVWQAGKMTQLPDSPDIFGAPVAIDASGTHVVIGVRLMLWTYVP